jgi:glycosyltransferase involved in cell wall biosynthesis
MGDSPRSISVISHVNADQKDSWSGIPYNVATSLRAAATVSTYCPIKITKPLGVPSYLIERIAGGRWLYSREPSVVHHWQRRASSHVARTNSDLALALSTLVVPRMARSRKALWIGSSWNQTVHYYPEWANVVSRSLSLGDLLEREALAACDQVIAVSDWAARAIELDYDVRVSAVIPWGAEDMAADASIVRRSRGGAIRLLSVGRDWYRKGLDDVVLALDYLVNEGLSFRWDIVGCEVPADYKRPYIVEHGWLSKDNGAESVFLRQLYIDSDLFVLPTRADAYGVAFGEAASAGLPVISRDTGGVGSVVLHERTGLLIPESGTANSLAVAIRRLSEDASLRKSMSAESRRHYESSLSWAAVGARISSVLGGG